MKTAFFISLAVALLAAGCSSGVVLTKDEQTPVDDATVYFYLRDGSYVKSESGQHPRVEGGYQVTGELFTQVQSSDMFWTHFHRQEFAGMVRDEDIKIATQKKLDVPVGAAIVAVTVGAIIRSGHDSGPR